MGWTDGYVGRPWVEGQFECLDLVLEASRDVFGAEVRVPPYAKGARARDRQMAELAAEYARRIDRPVRPGDLALMRPTGRLAGGHHVGVLASGGPEWLVLHCARGVGTCLHDRRGLRLAGFDVEGFYEWSPTSGRTR